MEKKPTLIDKFNEVKSVLAGIDGTDEQVEFIDSQIEKLEKQAAKAKERRAAKAEEEDPIIEAVKAALTDEFQTATEIADKVIAENPDLEVTKNKVVARLTKLADNITRDSVKPEGAKAKTTVYKLA